MDSLIAVLSWDGIPSTTEQCTSVLLFSRTEEGWGLTEEIPWHMIPDGEPQEVRDQVRSLILELGDCRIVVASRLSGLAYHVFDRMGFEIFEAEGIGDEMFDSILDDIRTAIDRRERKAEPTGPIPVDDQGRYCLDLIAMQKTHPEISSKRALRDFLRGNRSFYELNLICSHVPPWLDAELPGLRLDSRTEELGDGSLSVTIFRRFCKEGLK